MLMRENELYDYLQGLMPALQFVNPYHDDVPLPPPDVDFATMNIMPVSPIGWSQQRQKSYDSETGVVTLYQDIERVYRIQFDFYGPNAFYNAEVFQHTLQVNLVKPHGALVDLKKTGDIRNLSFLQENKAYMRRYSFDAEVFAVDTIETASPAIETATVKIINRGNNFN
jgi:hypothetical protein